MKRNRFGGSLSPSRSSNRCWTVKKPPRCSRFTQKPCRKWRAAAKSWRSRLVSCGAFGPRRSTGGWRKSPVEEQAVKPKKNIQTPVIVSYPDGGCQCRLNKGGILFRRTRYQEGSLTSEKRKRGPAVWVYRWWEKDIN